MLPLMRLRIEVSSAAGKEVLVDVIVVVVLCRVQARLAVHSTYQNFETFNGNFQEKR